VDKSDQQTYVAQRHLRPEPDPGPIEHPLLSYFFEELRGGVYVTRSKVN